MVSVILAQKAGLCFQCVKETGEGTILKYRLLQGVPRLIFPAMHGIAGGLHLVQANIAVCTVCIFYKQ